MGNLAKIFNSKGHKNQRITWFVVSTFLFNKKYAFFDTCDFGRLYYRKQTCANWHTMPGEEN